MIWWINDLKDGKMFSDTAISWIKDDKIPFFFWSTFINYPNRFLDDERKMLRGCSKWPGMGWDDIQDPLSVYPVYLSDLINPFIWMDMIFYIHLKTSIIFYLYPFKDFDQHLIKVLDTSTIFTSRIQQDDTHISHQGAVHNSSSSSPGGSVVDLSCWLSLTTDLNSGWQLTQSWKLQQGPGT